MKEKLEIKIKNMEDITFMLEEKEI